MILLKKSRLMVSCSFLKYETCNFGLLPGLVDSFVPVYCPYPREIEIAIGGKLVPSEGIPAAWRWELLTLILRFVERMVVKIL